MPLWWSGAMPPAEDSFVTELDVRIDEAHLQQVLDVAGIVGQPIPASYVLYWLAHPPIRDRLLSSNPAGCLPVFSRHMFLTYRKLQSGQSYRLAVTISRLGSKHAASRINYALRQDAARVLQGEVDVLFMPAAELARSW